MSGSYRPAPWFVPSAVSLCVAACASLLLPAHAQLARHPADVEQTAIPIIERQNLRDAAAGPADLSRPIHVQVALQQDGSLALDAAIDRRQPPAPVMHAPGNAVALHSEAVFVQDLDSNGILYDKNSTDIRPIASISKLMAALVVIDSGLPMDQMLTISDDDVDRMRYSRSRLAVGSRLSRGDMLHLALMSSENRATHALGRYHPGGMPAFVRAMNDKARALGMRNTRFVEPTGLSSDNVSSARDLVKLVQASAAEPLIRRYSTNDRYAVSLNPGRQLAYQNTNRLVKNDNWDILVSKTGYINEAGECLVMLTRVQGRDVAMILLNASPRSRIADAVRLRSQVLKHSQLALL